MALTYIDYSASGSNDSFLIPFDRISNSDVKVYLNSVLQSTGYSITGNNVVFTSAPSSGTTVRIRRITNTYTRSVDFTNGSRLDESDLDSDSKQAFFLLQENSDRIDTGLNQNSGGNYDAKAARIVSLSTPVDSTDAANKSYVDTVANNIVLGGLSDSSVTTSKIADGAITSAKIADGAIVTADIADGAITSAKISDGAIVTADLADKCVTTAKLNDNAVTSAKLDTAITSSLFLPGMIIPYGGTFYNGTTSNDWLLCDGGSYNRTTYAKLFAAIGTTWGPGDGSVTFNVPDLRGRVLAGLEQSDASRLVIQLSGRFTAGSAVVTGLSSTANLAVGMSAFSSAGLDNLFTSYTIVSIDSATQVTLSTSTGVNNAIGASVSFGYLNSRTLGSVGGTHTHTLALSQIPAHDHGLKYTTVLPNNGILNGVNSAGTGTAIPNTGGTGGGGQPHSNLQPTAIVNYIIKI